MWKFLKYWTGLQLMVNMPFILPLASAMQTLFQRRDSPRSDPSPAPQKPPRVLVTYTGPDPGDAGATQTVAAHLSARILPR